MASARWTRKRSVDMGVTEQELSDGLLIALANSTLADKVSQILCADLRREVGSLREAVKTRDARITQLEQKVEEQSHLIDTLEQYSRRNSMRLNGVVETEHEDLLATCMALFNSRMAVEPPIRSDDIDRIHRVGKPGPGRKRAVLVKFATYQAKERVYRFKSKLKPGARDPNAPWPLNQPRGLPATPELPTAEYPALNQNGPPPLNDTSSADTANLTPEVEPAAEDEPAAEVEPAVDDDLTHDDRPTPTIPDKIVKAISHRIYINDDLTGKRDFVLFVARQSKKQAKILDTWSYNGNIRIKDLNGLIHTVTELSQIPDSADIINHVTRSRNGSS